MSCWLLCLAGICAAEEPASRQLVMVVVGAQGEPGYGEQFGQWAQRWRAAAEQAHAEYFEIGTSSGEPTDDRDVLRMRLAAAEPASVEPLWLVFVGHGTYDGRTAKFNLRGPDLSSADLKTWLQPLDRPLAVINCASASGPFINQLTGPRRIIVTATKSGDEHNYARFGEYLSQAITAPSADLDQDGQTSLLEAFVSASAQVQSFYEQEGRLASEHALLDDNGDGLGTPAAWFRGVRATRAAQGGSLPDGLLANQVCLIRTAAEQQLPSETRARRDALELEIARLREQKNQIAEDQYYRRLESLALELARLYRDLAVPAAGDPSLQPERR